MVTNKKTVKIEIAVEEKTSDENERATGNAERRLIPVGFYWSEVWGEEGPPFCVHGEKLRWSCDYCLEHFSK